MDIPEKIFNIFKDFSEKSKKSQIIGAIQFRSIVAEELSDGIHTNSTNFIKIFNSILLDVFCNNIQNTDIKKYLLRILGYVADKDVIFQDKSFETFWYEFQGDSVSDKISVSDLRNYFLQISLEPLPLKKEFDSNDKLISKKYHQMISKKPSEFYDALISVVDIIIAKISSRQMPNMLSNINIPSSIDDTSLNNLPLNDDKDKLLHYNERDKLLTDVNDHNLKDKYGFKGGDTNAIELEKFSINKEQPSTSSISNTGVVKDYDVNLNKLSDEQFIKLIQKMSTQNTHKKQNVEYEDLLKERLKDKNERLKDKDERLKDKDERLKDKDEIIKQMNLRINDKEQFESYAKKQNEILTDFVTKFNKVENLVNELRPLTYKLSATKKSIKEGQLDGTVSKKTADKIVMHKKICCVERTFDFDFDLLKSDEIIMKESHSFYTSKRGYKMCLRIYANGNGKEGRGRHLSLFYAVMKGDYDDKLRWPFSGIVTLTLLDKTKTMCKKHFYKIFSKCKFPECYVRPSEDYNEAYGDRTFYPLKDLSPESRYLINGTIFVKISIEMK